MTNSVHRGLPLPPGFRENVGVRSPIWRRLSRIHALYPKNNFFVFSISYEVSVKSYVFTENLRDFDKMFWSFTLYMGALCEDCEGICPASQLRSPQHLQQKRCKAPLFAEGLYWAILAAQIPWLRLCPTNTCSRRSPTDT